jgi:hypothetical protein
VATFCFTIFLHNFFNVYRVLVSLKQCELVWCISNVCISNVLLNVHVKSVHSLSHLRKTICFVEPITVP